MAATDRIQVFMTETGDRFWTNVFHVNALTLDAAASFANTVIATALADQMDNHFKVVKTLVSHIGDGSFISTPLNIVGAGTAGTFLPLFNTAKILVSVSGAGRNDYKYLRAVLTEGRVTNGQIDSGVVTSLESTWNGLIADGTAAGVDLVDDEGHLWQVATCQQAIQMRQLHRRRRRVVVAP